MARNPNHRPQQTGGNVSQAEHTSNHPTHVEAQQVSSDQTVEVERVVEGDPAARQDAQTGSEHGESQGQSKQETGVAVHADGSEGERSSGAGGTDEEGHRLNQDGSIDKRQFNTAPNEDEFPRNTASEELGENGGQQASNQQEDEITEENTRPDAESKGEEEVVVTRAELETVVQATMEDATEAMFAELFSEDNSSAQPTQTSATTSQTSDTSGNTETVQLPVGQSPFKTTGALKLRRPNNEWVVCETELGEGGIPLKDGSGNKITGPFNKTAKQAVTDALTRMARETGFFKDKQEFTYHGNTPIVRIEANAQGVAAVLLTN